MNYSIIHYPNRSRFEIEMEGLTAYVEYLRTDDVFDIIHTIVPQPLEGRGIASSLVRTAFDYARDNKLTLKAACPYAHAWLLHHPEYLEKP